MLGTLITVVTLAILVSALCSLCEAVLYSISSSQVELLKKTGHSSAYLMENLRRDIDKPITAILTLNTIANTVGASIAGALVAKMMGDHFVIWFSIAFTLAILIFSEIIPKTLGVSFSIKLAPTITYPLHVMVVVLRPIIWLCRIITRIIPKSKGSGTVSAEEIRTIAALSLKSGEIELDQERVIKNVLVLQKKMVRQVMTPRTVTFSLNENINVIEAMELIAQKNSHSRIPVYNSEPDNVTGIVMREDILLSAARLQGELQLGSFKQPVHFVPETAPLNRIFIDFFDRRQHLFMVVDEYGSMTGVISMEDILEEIVGREIVDESDKNRDMRELARTQTIEILKNND